MLILLAVAGLAAGSYGSYKFRNQRIEAEASTNTAIVAQQAAEARLKRVKEVYVTPPAPVNLIGDELIHFMEYLRFNEVDGAYTLKGFAALSTNITVGARIKDAAKPLPDTPKHVGIPLRLNGTMTNYQNFKRFVVGLRSMPVTLNSFGITPNGTGGAEFELTMTLVGRAEERT